MVLSWHDERKLAKPNRPLAKLQPIGEFAAIRSPNCLSPAVVLDYRGKPAQVWPVRGILGNGLKFVTRKTVTEPPAQRSSASTPQDKSGTIHLRLLATSDLHVHILPYDYFAGHATDRLGLARTASLIEAARTEVENCLLFDNGDFLQGSLMGDYHAQGDGTPATGAHPMLAAMNHLGYDAGTLGNHEFNYGLDFLAASLADADFPLVSANVFAAAGHRAGQTLIPPYAILDRVVLDDDGVSHPIRIGVIGFTPPQIMTWDHRHLHGRLTTKDIVETAIAMVPQMQVDGADLIIALSHSGIGTSKASPGLENASTALAQVAGIDAVIAGHSHLVFPSDDFQQTPDIDPVKGTLCGKPAVMPGLYGSHLGVIDLYLSHDAGKYRVRRHHAEARPIWQRNAQGTGTALVKSHVGIVAITDAAHRETLGWTSRPVGHTPVPLHSYFALLAETPALSLVAAAQRQFVREALSTTPDAGLPVLGSVAPFKAGGRGGPENYTDVPAGGVMQRHAADLYSLPNTSAAIRLTGAEIASWLEFAVGIFNQIPDGSTDADLINPDFPSFNFDLIFGLDFQIDLGRPPRFDVRGALINPHSHRIVGLTYQGAPLDPCQDFAIATNSYRVAANAGVLSPAEGRVLLQTTKTNLSAVLSYLATNTATAIVAHPKHRFAAMPGTSVVFDTSPKALAHLAELGEMKIEPVGLTQPGFQRFRLHL